MVNGPASLNSSFCCADIIAVMRNGRILQLGTRTELVDRPSDPYVHDLLALVGTTAS